MFLNILIILFTTLVLPGYSYQSLCKIRSNYCKCQSKENVEVQISHFLKSCCQPGIMKLILENIFIAQVSENAFINSPCHQLEEILLNKTTQLIADEKNPFLHKNSFLGLPNLKRLVIEGNRELKALPSGVFHGLGGSLVELSLSKNRIHSLNGDEFDGFSIKNNRLKALDLSHNEIKSLDGKFFPQLTHEGVSPLKRLNLDFNKLTAIRQEMFHGLDSLEELSILENPMEIIYGGGFKNLIKLNILSISGNFSPKRKGGDISTLTQAMFHGLSMLKSLTMNNLGIVEIQENAFLDIIDLRKLDLSNNQIRRVPTVVLERLGGILGKQLEELNLSNNEIICINNDPFKYLNWLRVLDLSNNRIRVINDKTLQGLDNLQRLILTGNNLGKIAPYSFKHFKRLNELHVNILEQRELKIVREAFLKSALGILSNRTRVIGLENMGIQHGGSSRFLDDFSSLENFECLAEEFLIEEERSKDELEKEYELETLVETNSANSSDLFAFFKENKSTIIMIGITTLIVTFILISLLMIYRCCCRLTKKRKELPSRLFSDASSSIHAKSPMISPDSYNFINSYKAGYNSARSFSPVSGMGHDNAGNMHTPNTNDSGKFRSLFSQTSCIGKMPINSTMNSCNSSVNQSKYRESDILNNLQIAPPPYPQHSRSPFLSHDQSNLLNNVENLSSASGTLLSNNKVSSLIGSGSGVRVMSAAGSTERTNTTPCTNSSIDGNLGVILQPNSPNSINNEFASVHFDAFNSFGLV